MAMVRGLLLGGIEVRPQSLEQLGELGSLEVSAIGELVVGALELLRDLAHLGDRNERIVVGAELHHERDVGADALPLPRTRVVACVYASLCECMSELGTVERECVCVTRTTRPLASIAKVRDTRSHENDAKHSMALGVAESMASSAWWHAISSEGSSVPHRGLGARRVSDDDRVLATSELVLHEGQPDELARSHGIGHVAQHGLDAELAHSITNPRIPHARRDIACSIAWHDHHTNHGGSVVYDLGVGLDWIGLEWIGWCRSR